MYKNKGHRYVGGMTVVYRWYVDESIMTPFVKSSSEHKISEFQCIGRKIFIKSKCFFFLIH